MKINAFPMRYEIWKGRKKSSAKGGLELGSKSMRIIIYYATGTDV